MRVFDGSNPAAIGTVTASAAGTWTFTSAALPQGGHALTAKAVDASGNVSDPSAEVKVTIDTQAPAVPTVPDLAAGSDSAVNDDNVTSDNTPTFVGGAEAGSTVRLIEGTEQRGSVVATAAGYSVTSQQLGDGARTVKAAATDLAGNSSADSDGLTVTIDTQAPSVAVTGYSNDQVFYTGGVMPTVGCTPATSSPTVTAGGLNSNGVGSVSYSCSATDLAGNTGSETRRYSVQYGGKSGILQPINPDNSSLFSRGRAVPIKFQLAGDGANTAFATGFGTTAWGAPKATQVSCTNTAEALVTESVPSNTPSSVIRYDATADQYIYNADFSTKSAGTCWKVTVHTDDSTFMTSAVFKLQK